MLLRAAILQKKNRWVPLIKWLQIRVKGRKRDRKELPLNYTQEHQAYSTICHGMLQLKNWFDWTGLNETENISLD